MGADAVRASRPFFCALLKRAKGYVLFEKNQKVLFISSDSRRKGTKEDCYPKPLQRGCN